MQYNDSHTYRQTAQDAEIPTVQPIYITGGGTAIVVIAMLLLTIIIIYITSQNAGSAPFGIVGSVLFFLVGTPVGLLSVNGGIATMHRSWEEQRTLRRYNDQQAQIQVMQLGVSGVPQLPPGEPTDLPRLPAGPRFVPPVPVAGDEMRAAAAGWIAQLFDPETGKATRITRNKGQIQIKSPEPEVVDYLESLGIVRVGEGKQLYWDMALYPNRRSALQAIRTGGRPSPSEGGGGGGYQLESGAA